MERDIIKWVSKLQPSSRTAFIGVVFLCFGLSPVIGGFSIQEDMQWAAIGLGVFFSTASIIMLFKPPPEQNRRAEDSDPE